MGFVLTFEKEGFRYIKDAGARRHVMICRCDGENHDLVSNAVILFAIA
ncbi:hypothetical protein ACHOLT_17505 [Desulfitobacterium sp. Sab5]